MTVYPFVIHLGPLELTGYGLMMMVAFLMAGWAMQLDLRRRGLDEEYAADIVIAGVVGGLVGAKIWYVLLTSDWNALLRRGGFVWYGGFLGATAAILINGWRRRVSWRFTVELCAAPLALGYALGRVGCFLVNDDYGIPSSLPWAMKFPNGLPATTIANLEGLGVRFPAGMDSAPAAVEASRERARSAGFGNVIFAVGDPAEMPFNEPFDAVVGRVVSRRHGWRATHRGPPDPDLRDDPDDAGVLVDVAPARSRARRRLDARVLPGLRRPGAVSRGARPRRLRGLERRRHGRDE